MNLRLIKSLPLRVIVHPATVAAASVAFLAFIRWMDTRWAYLPYVVAVTLALATLIFLVSRRPVFSLYAAGAFSVLQALASLVKFKLNGLALRVYDLFFTAGNGSLISFLLGSYLPVMIVSALVLLLCGLFLLLAFRLDRQLRYNGWMRSALVPVALSLCFTAYPRAKTHDSDYLPFTGGYNASALYFSLAHIRYLIEPPPISAKLAGVTIDKPLEDRVECGSARSDLFVVLAESLAPPDMFPDIETPAGLADEFRSGDGVRRGLRVETYGAGTWMTNFSVLTGLPTAEIGWQAPYVNELLENRIRGSLPEVMARCGYRTVAMTTLKYHALNEGPFLKSLGFEEVYDAPAMGLDRPGVRDREYFDFALKLLAEHRRTDGRPLFLAMQTMFPHGPFTGSLVPVGELPVTMFAADRETNEYMRRLIVSRRDFRRFYDSLEQMPGPQGTIVAEFGDHQSTATPHFARQKNRAHGGVTDFSSPMYATYFAVHAFGRDLDWAALGESRDASMLAAAVLDAADLPTSPLFADLAILGQACEGRFHLCADRPAIDRHLKSRIAAGMLLTD